MLSSSSLLHKFGIAAEHSLLMLHLIDVYYCAEMAMKDVFVVITSIGIGKFMVMKDSDVIIMLCCFSYVVIKFFLTLFMMTNATSKDGVGVKLFMLLNDDDDDDDDDDGGDE